MDRYVVEINKLIIRLDKLIGLDVLMEISKRRGKLLYFSCCDINRKSLLDLM